MSKSNKCRTGRSDTAVSAPILFSERGNPYSCIVYIISYIINACEDEFLLG